MDVWVMLIVFCVASYVMGCHSLRDGDGFVSTAIFPVAGNVYPHGYFYTAIKIGDPPKPYYLDIDTGSDLSWVQCDAPCVNCFKAPHKPYKPRDNALPCKEQVCSVLPHPPNFACQDPSEQCDYGIEYADHGSSIGVLVKDNFSLRFFNGSIVRLPLAFGCGYNQRVSGSSHPPYVDGVLGLADGKSSILSQLHHLKITKNTFGHCFASRGGGYFFFGDALASDETVWVPMTDHRSGFASILPIHPFAPLLPDV